jgi:hypothetical protein
MLDFKASICVASYTGLRIIYEMNLTASSTWVIGQKSNVKLVTYLVTFTFNDPPNLSTHYSTCYLECDEVPCKAP